MELRPLLDALFVVALKLASGFVELVELGLVAGHATPA